MNQAQVFRVDGMTCGHCEAAVRMVFEQLPGIVEVRVDRAAGLVNALGEGAIDTAALARALEDEGFSLVSEGA